MFFNVKNPGSLKQLNHRTDSRSPDLTTNISHVFNDITQNINTPHEGVHPQPFIVVVQEDGCVVDGREAVSRDALSP